MKKVNSSLIELIGHTPLLEPARFNARYAQSARLLLKLESFNPGGSVKDRVALALIEDAEKKGQLAAGGTIIEPTSGNTGIGLAWIGAVKGYKVVLTMPETMSIERRNLLKALGANLVLTEGAKGMNGAIQKARELQESTPGSIILGQFDNPANPEMHARTTAEEIWSDTDGKVDLLVAGVGTGGTLSGTAQRLHQLNPALKAVAVEPASSAVLSGHQPGKHAIQGIGAGFVPKNFDRRQAAEILQIAEDEAIKTSRALARTEGLLVGISSGAAVNAALQLARRPENKGKTIVVVLPDTGERYLSTALYDFTDKPLPDLE